MTAESSAAKASAQSALEPQKQGDEWQDWKYQIINQMGQQQQQQQQQQQPNLGSFEGQFLLATSTSLISHFLGQCCGQKCSRWTSIPRRCRSSRPRGPRCMLCSKKAFVPVHSYFDCAPAGLDNTAHSGAIHSLHQSEHAHFRTLSAATATFSQRCTATKVSEANNKYQCSTCVTKFVHTSAREERLVIELPDAGVKRAV